MINTQGLPDTGDYLIGRGIIYYSSINALGFPLEYRDLGNCPDFKMSVTTTTIAHTSSRHGLKQQDRLVVTEQKIKLTFTIDECMNFDNLALLTSGNTGTLAQAAGAVTVAALSGNVILSGKARWYDLYDYTGSPTPVYPQTDITKRVVAITTVIVKNLAGTVTYAEGTDYTVDYNFGRIFITAGSAIGATATIAVTFTKTAKTRDFVNPLTISQVTGALKFIGVNANDASWLTEFQFHSVTLNASGDTQLIGDTFGTMQFDGAVQAVEAVNAAYPTGLIVSYPQP